jgi:hypothetical protein
MSTITVTSRRRRLVLTDKDRRTWQAERLTQHFDAGAAAVVVCDVWDRHWSRGAAERVAELAPRIDGFCRRLRAAGALIAHAPSDTMDVYQGSPARARVQGLRGSRPAGWLEVPAIPFEIENGGSDTEDEFPPDTPVWSRQHESIEIDQNRDIITDDGEELVTHFRMSGREMVLMTGVHTNLCILERSFGLRALTSQGFTAFLVADLTDAMYDPAQPPYVSHEEGTALVIHYVEAFVAPTVTSADVVIG